MEEQNVISPPLEGGVRGGTASRLTSPNPSFVSRGTVRDHINILLPGNAWPIDSYVFRPTIIACPYVISLNNFNSSGICHGVLPDLPITLFGSIAAMRVITPPSFPALSVFLVSFPLGLCEQSRILPYLRAYALQEEDMLVQII